MRATSSLLAVFAVSIVLFSAPARAQGLSTLSNDGFAPMSLMPDAVAIPNAGSFQMVSPAPTGGLDASGAATTEPVGRSAPLPTRSFARAIAGPDEAETAGTKIVRNIPMPPRRPFNLGFGKKQKALLARTEVTEPSAVVSAAVPKNTRSLMALEDLPGVRVRSNSLVQQASLQSDENVRSDATPDASSFVGEGRIGGGLLKQTPSVQTGCLRPDLLSILRKAGKRFGRPVVITSGFRGGGRRGSYHRKCMAADVKIDGVSKQTLAAYFRSLPEAGGVGTYCHNGVVHVDTAEPRNWTYCGFRRTSFSLRGGGWNGNVHVKAGQALPDSADDGE